MTPEELEEDFEAFMDQVFCSLLHLDDSPECQDELKLLRSYYKEKYFTKEGEDHATNSRSINQVDSKPVTRNATDSRPREKDQSGTRQVFAEDGRDEDVYNVWKDGKCD